MRRAEVRLRMARIRAGLVRASAHRYQNMSEKKSYVNFGGSSV